LKTKWLLGLLTGALLAQPAFAETYEIKVAHFVPAGHPISKYLEAWGQDLEKKSNGRFVVKQFPGSQMGPTPVYFDHVRKGTAEVAWFLHGATPGRFPLTELVNLPYMVGSAEIGCKMMNDPALRKYLDEEHKGVRVLYLMTHQPGNIHTRDKAVRTTADMKGLRIRFASATIKDWVAALGGTPVGVPPPDQAENLQKGTIDGVFIDYGGALTFKIGPMIKYTTEMYSYVSSFGVAINPAFYDKLPADLKKLIDDTTKNAPNEVGKLWDALDAPGKKYMTDSGDTPIKLTAEENAKFRQIGEQVAEAKIKELEDKKLPARDVYKLMKQLAAKYEKDSFSFWK
jgi:TRAP-type C4-dicarboxylate transport system substrate-binding protein